MDREVVASIVYIEKLDKNRRKKTFVSMIDPQMLLM